MIVEEKFDIACPIDEMYRQLNDVGEIGYCIAGVQEVTVHSPDESTWKVIFRAGIMQRTVSLNARIVERVAPTRIGFAGDGQDVEIGGHVDLEPVDADVTRCTIVIEANITGPLGPLVELMAKGPQQALILETISNLKSRLEGTTSAPQLATAATARTSVSPRSDTSWFAAMFRRFRAWFGRGDSGDKNSGARS
jgi:carbon monoxide dehydrogenase subunit G